MPHWPVARHYESKPSRWPIDECKRGRAPYQSRGGAGQGPQLTSPRARRWWQLRTASRSRSEQVFVPASLVPFRCVVSRGRGRMPSQPIGGRGNVSGGGAGSCSVNRRPGVGPNAGNRRSCGRLAGDGRWAESGDHGDRNGSDSSGAGGAGEARGLAAGMGRGRWARAADSGLSPQEEEFRWLLHDEVHAVLRQLQDILKVTPCGAPRAFACSHLP